MIRCMGCMAEMADGLEVCPHCGYVRGTPPREAYHLVPESILEGRYIVGRVLGYGGFGVTYIGYDAQLDRIVAIKEFLPSTFATRMPGNTSVTVYDGAATEQFGFGLDRFVQEAQRLAQFNGIPGVTDIYDTFAGNNTAYIIMEFLKGRDVKEMLSTRGPLPYEEARDIILHVCDTLAPVHAKGIIHRDLSPDNIYITDAGEVKLLDFGAARYESSVNSKSLSVILKAGYAPEEQYRSRGDQGPWTDVYALAATFYKILTGVTPEDSMERAIRDELKEPSKLGVEIPLSAENALMNALNIRKSDRTQSVEEFKAALLADGVERVKVKVRRADAGRVPTWAKIVLPIALVLIAGFGVLTLTGAFDVTGGGAKLEDTFGSPVQEGYVLVPNLTGIQQAEAEAMLTEAGLVPEVGEAIYSDTVPRGEVTAQEPLSGRQLEEGGTVTLSISSGSVESAIEDGLIPPVIGMDVTQASAYIKGLNDSFYFDTKYAYSDSAETGTVMSHTREPESNRMIFEVSAGGNNGPNLHGEMRAPFFEFSTNGLYAEHVVASADYIEDYDNRPHYKWVYSVSPDEGASWSPLREENGYYYLNDEDAAEGRPMHTQTGLYYNLLDRYEELAGKTLTIKLERYLLDEDYNETGLLDSLVFPQTVALQLVDNPVRVDSMEILSWETVQTMADAGELNNYSEWTDILASSGDEDRKRYTAAVLVHGEFEPNANLNFYQKGEQSLNNTWTDDASTVKMLLRDYGMEYGARAVYNFYIFGAAKVETDGAANNITWQIPTPVRYTLLPNENIAAVSGLVMNEALDILRPLAVPDVYLNRRFALHDTIPAGHVITWGGEKYEERGDGYSSLSLIVSVGASETQPAVLPLEASVYGSYNFPWAAQSYGIYFAGREYVDVEMQYSTDGGSNWKTLDGRYETRNYYYNEPGYYYEGLPVSESTMDLRYLARDDSSIETAAQLKGRVAIYDSSTGEALGSTEFDFVRSDTLLDDRETNEAYGMDDADRERTAEEEAKAAEEAKAKEAAGG